MLIPSPIKSFSLIDKTVTYRQLSFFPLAVCLWRILTRSLTSYVVCLLLLFVFFFTNSERFLPFLLSEVSHLSRKE